MPRSKITSGSKDIIKDDGAILASVVDGEQIQLEITLNWLVNLTGYSIKVTVVEAVNTLTDVLPTEILVGGQRQDLPIIDDIITDNQFKIVFPEGLISFWAVQPTPEHPVYGFIELEVRDTGVGAEQQIWKPVRGLVQVLYSPTEV